jgi:uncharacterized LabA/DUF88 family protein
MGPRTILFVDGENLVFRFQEEVKAGRTPNDDLIHEPDCFVWHPAMARVSRYDLFRVCYYTTVVGDEDRVESVKRKLAEIKFAAVPADGPVMTGQVVPAVFKKLQRSTKTRVVDIRLIIDVLRYAHSDAIDLIYLVSGDQDYLPLINEVMHLGKQVYVGALSSGLAKPLTYNCDEFFNLDRLFFKDG